MLRCKGIIGSTELKSMSAYSYSAEKKYCLVLFVSLTVALALQGGGFLGGSNTLP